MTRNRKAACGVAVAMMASLFTLPAHATPAITLGAINGFASQSPAMIGFDFTVTGSVVVTALGVYEQNLDGFAESHQVGLWDATTDTLLASTTLAAGKSGTLIGPFRYDPVASTTLRPGDTYVLAALFLGSGGFLVFDGFPQDCCGTTFTTDPRVVIDNAAGRFVNTTSFMLPGQGFIAQFPVNFLIDQPLGQAVPEPADFLLLGTALVALGVTRRRARPAVGA